MIALSVCAISIALTLSGCGGGGGGGGGGGPDAPTTTTTTTASTFCRLDQGQCAHCLHGQCIDCNPGYVKDTNSVTGGTCVASCVGQDPLPKPDKPSRPLDLNGKAWPLLCVNKTTAHFFGIGDWGGNGESGKTWRNPRKCYPAPAPPGKRECTDADLWAQKYVARQMKRVAPTSKPDYVINVGDNFYPGGIVGTCEKPSKSGQWRAQFEKVYLADDANGTPSPLKGLVWHSVLGNHDYGGNSFSSAWDQQIMETWNRDTWLMPGQYWSRTVQYSDFAVEYFFLDSNYQDGNVGPDHCICQGSKECYGMNKDNCMSMLMQAYMNGRKMLEAGLKKSTAEWHIVVTHFPAVSFAGDPWFQNLNKLYGIDLLITGHTHAQHTGNSNGMQWVLTGGGGGVTSDDAPILPGGNDTAYGFVDFGINRTHLSYDMHTWGGSKTTDGEIVIRTSVTITAHEKKVPMEEMVV